MNENKQPKHILAVIGFILSIIAIIFSFFGYNILTDVLDSNNDSATALLSLASYSSYAAIISSAIAKKHKNTEIYSTLGIVIAVVALVIIIISAGVLAAG